MAVMTEDTAWIAAAVVGERRSNNATVASAVIDR
jgi:hypothetical protein